MCDWKRLRCVTRKNSFTSDAAMLRLTRLWRRKEKAAVVRVRFAQKACFLTHFLSQARRKILWRKNVANRILSLQSSRCADQNTLRCATAFQPNVPCVGGSHGGFSSRNRKRLETNPSTSRGRSEIIKGRNETRRDG